MEEHEESHPIGSLFEKAEEYTKTTIELMKLKAIDTTSDIISSILARIINFILVILFILVLNIGVGFWLGELLGKNYYGFFILAGFYLLVCLIFHFFRSALLKTPISNAFIRHVLKRRES